MPCNIREECLTLAMLPLSAWCLKTCRLCGHSHGRMLLKKTIQTGRKRTPKWLGMPNFYKEIELDRILFSSLHCVFSLTNVCFCSIWESYLKFSCSKLCYGEVIVCQKSWKYDWRWFFCGWRNMDDFLTNFDVTKDNPWGRALCSVVHIFPSLCYWKYANSWD